MSKEVAKQIKDAMKNPKEKPEVEVIDENTLYIPSGSKMLDLACSDTAKGAFVTGRMVNLIGDSSAGKSILALSMLAEMSIDPAFDDYRFIYDDAEEASSFDMEDLFGQRLVDRIEPPKYDNNGIPLHSDTIQDFNLNIFDMFDDKRPFIYILDSFDSLTSKAEIEVTDTNLKALRKGTKAQGTYGMDKPKIMGQILRMITSKLKETKSFILIISQTRDNIGGRAAKTRSGGNALKFYASHEIWLTYIGNITKTVQGIERIIGVNTKAKVTKNKLTGKKRDVDFSIYYEYGIDDIGASIGFLLDAQHWTLKKQTILATDLGLEGVKQTIVKGVEDKGLEKELFQIACDVWLAIEEQLKLNRKSKFDR